LGLCFVLLLERGPGREHIAIQSYMLAMIAGLGALFAGILAVPQLREFFDMAMLGAEQWFISMLAAALGLVFASLMWRLPQIQAWEVPDESAFPPLERVPPPENAPPQRPTAGPIHRETTPVHEEAEAATEVIPAEADLLDDRD
ncbi:MAG: hypothetical protein KDM64_18040, partial [Verrucomicrobiae bacterium]|nr:hypothetical protein [Verrucomicrobiae bacterium]